MGRTQTEETKKKISESLKKKWEDPEYQKSVLSKQSLHIGAQKQKWIDKLFEEDWDSLTYERKRRRLLIEQDYKCNRCSLKEWMDHPIKLEFEHIDGNSTNNKRENCEALCPNCHSLTTTWRGHNKSNTGKQKITESEFIHALKSNTTIRQALLYLGLASKGGNYKRAKKIMMKYDITHIED
jgi:hypothetical protein